MGPKTETFHPSSIGMKYIPEQKGVFKHIEGWIEDKRKFDGAEGLWRVHNGLYDLSSFIQKHPGGTFWLEATKGLDITEAFESHHVSTKPEDVLKKHFVRAALTPRISPFTFEENGFYRTVKKKVREALKTIPKTNATTSKIMIDLLLFSTFVTAAIGNSYQSFIIGTLSGLLLSLTSLAAHNYYHQKDNFRMYYSDLALLQSRELRIIHVISHHSFTNTLADMQVYLSEPLLNYCPVPKTKLLKYGSWIYGPLLMWPTFMFWLVCNRLYCWIYLKHNTISKIDLLPLSLPTFMYILSGQSIMATLGMWIYMVAVHSFWFVLTGFTFSHLHPKIFLDGDKPRAEKTDWGLLQLDTVLDRYEVTGSQFLALVTFGDHALHHLFPTLDHGVLQHLYPVVEETLKQYEVEIGMTTQVDMIKGYFQRLASETPNSNPPSLLK